MLSLVLRYQFLLLLPMGIFHLCLLIPGSAVPKGLVLPIGQAIGAASLAASTDLDLRPSVMSGSLAFWTLVYDCCGKLP